MKQFYQNCKILLFAIFLSTISLEIQAQNLKITGLVIDASDNSPLPGVTVSVKAQQKKAITDVDGKYTLSNMKEQDILIFSYVGYNSSEISIKELQKNNYQVNLSQNLSKLDEVVVVGYGTQKRSEVTGSIGSIKADQMDQFSGGSLNTSLQGKIAGLQITTNSGEPGAGANITLRGVSSINGASQPLFIIDGIPVNNDNYGALNDEASFSPLNDINPSDIESIEVLKDGATASIYGSRASNGVIIITTKKGTTVKPVINFSFNSSLVELTRKIGILNARDFREAYTESIYNSTDILTTKVSVIDSLHPYYRDSYNWQDIMYRQALQYKLDMSVNGASKDRTIDYYISAGYRDLKPIVVETQYKQLFATSRINYKISKTIQGSTNFNLSNFLYNRQNNSIISRYLSALPVYGPYDPITGEVIPLFEGNRPSALAQAIYSTNDIKRWRLLGKQEISVNILKDLVFKTNISVDYSTTDSYFFSPPIFSTASSVRSIFSDFRPEVRSSFINENILTYKLKIKKNHNFDFLLGQSYQLFRTDETYVRGIGNIDNQITSIAGSANITNFSQTQEENALASFFGRANYNYKSKYLLSLVLRRDASSRFGENNQASYFPSVSAGWKFSSEKFASDLTWLYEGKLRASYGITGNQTIGNYASQGAISRQGSYLGNLGLVSTNLANGNLKWETTKQFDIGLDLSFLKGRFNVTTDYYIKNSSDLLFNVQIPIQSGYNSIPYNFGSLSNKGFELALDGVIIDKKFKWSSIFTIGINKNTVTELPGNEDYRPNQFSLARVGEAVGVFYGFKALGVYARDEDNVYTTDANGNVIPYRKGSSSGAIYKAGDVIYEDVNGDGVINLDDLQIIGDPTPKAFGGLQNTFRYKNFTFSFFLNYVIGNDLFNNLVRSLDGSIFDTNYSTNQLRRWRKPGDVTDVPRIIKGDPMETYAISDRFIEDGTFVRLQNTSLAYNLPRNIVNKLKLSSANIGVSVQNLFTWGSYSGYDPEISTGNNPLGYGLDNGSFPRTRSFNLTLNAKF
ncbi:SusC/RagA family TonB-linked outer membrane protein [Pedobacter glucosidilyticus]|uniref:SusC/RagA family TonB-linked outer membrane protein n=1 Tax=Pedobacter glucosidilyticus TaxID=1122941 RepID=UPI0026F032E4|nr:TonB-dependent receptor [Pedobacter glucosidilyticus]